MIKSIQIQLWQYIQLHEDFVLDDGVGDGDGGSVGDDDDGGDGDSDGDGDDGTVMMAMMMMTDRSKQWRRSNYNDCNHHQPSLGHTADNSG